MVNNIMNIVVVGAGYVGLSNAILLAQKNNVTLVDISDEKLKLINEKKSPIRDDCIEDYLKNKNLNLITTINGDDVYREADLVIIATPTDYNEYTNCFDTSSVEKVIESVININKEAVILIKSTIPVGFTEKIKLKFKTNKIIFSPEFLREGKALHDNLYPSRIVIGNKFEIGEEIAKIFLEGAIKKDIPVVLTSSTEAEAIKLFSNTYLAMRVAYFNELDSYAEINNLNSKEIINGVCLDERIGNHYNNPSFGYGGYCLPKDTKQLLANYKNVPNTLIKAIVSANETRKNFVASRIIEKKPEVVGIYRLIMKSGSDNFRSSAIQSIIKILLENKINIIIYEPNFSGEDYLGLQVVNEFDRFESRSNIIIANRIDEKLIKLKNKVYTRDVFGEN